MNSVKMYSISALKLIEDSGMIYEMSFITSAVYGGYQRFIKLHIIIIIMFFVFIITGRIRHCCEELVNGLCSAFITFWKDGQSQTTM